MRRNILNPAEQLWVGRFGFALLTASVTMPYAWTPQTFSYNDWAAVFGMLAAALILLMFSSGGKTGCYSMARVFCWMTAVGLMLGWLLFIKWTSAAGVGALLVIVVWCGWGWHWRLCGSSLLGMLAGTVLALVFIHLTCP